MTWQPDIDWYKQINKVNRHQLQNPPSQLKIKRIDYRFIKSIARQILGRDLPKSMVNWQIALNTLGMEYCHKYSGDENILNELRIFYLRHLDSTGRWKTSLARVDYFMKLYSLIYMNNICDNQFDSVIHYSANKILEAPRSADGSIAYVSNTNHILVDTLGMICPFLARYGFQFSNLMALDLAVRQLQNFISENVDAEFHLPYHAYRPNIEKHLGLHGWGRGTGWYMLGLADTLAELPADYPGYSLLLDAFSQTAEAVLKLQMPDGHWGASLLDSGAVYDTSATSMIGYALARGVQNKLLPDFYLENISNAVKALAGATNSGGVIQHSSGECRWLNQYSTEFEPTVWAQGASVALASVYFQIAAIKN